MKKIELTVIVRESYHSTIPQQVFCDPSVRLTDLHQHIAESFQKQAPQLYGKEIISIVWRTKGALT